MHISDTHSSTTLKNLVIPECDVLIHSGDLNWRTTPLELDEFLKWFVEQPARKKVFVAGNHDISLDPRFAEKLRIKDRMYEWSKHLDEYKTCMEMIDSYDVKYLINTDYVFEGVKFWGSPYSPNFHEERWAFNAERGNEIKKIWGRIPSDVDVLITHGPPYGILDFITEDYKENEDEDINKGCQDLLSVIQKRLIKLQLSCFGHIHENTGLLYLPVFRTRTIMFSNGAVVTNDYKQVIKKPLIITL